MLDDIPVFVFCRPGAGELDCVLPSVNWSEDAADLLDTALTVVMAADGYPGAPARGGAIVGIDAAEAAGGKVFHAGTALAGNTLVANGGRVLNVTATGATIEQAQALAYTAVDAIDFPTGFCRRDIGWRELARGD